MKEHHFIDSLINHSNQLQRQASVGTTGPSLTPPWSVPLVVGPDQAGPVHRQDPVADLQPAVGGGGSVGDQRADVDARSVEGCVLQRESEREASVRPAERTDVQLQL